MASPPESHFESLSDEVNRLSEDIQPILGTVRDHAWGYINHLYDEGDNDVVARPKRIIGAGVRFNLSGSKGDQTPSPYVHITYHPDTDIVIGGEQHIDRPLSDFAEWFDGQQ